MRRSRPLAPLAVALLACLVALLLAVPSGAAAAQPIKGKPRIVDIEGFAYPTDFSLAHWRAGAVLVTRYPKVLPSAFPAQIRKLLTFRAVGKLKVSDHGTRIASRKDNGGLPVAAAGHSVYYAHLLVFTQKQSERIFDSLGLERSARGWPSAGNVRTRASAQVRVKAKGRTVARSGAKSAQKVVLAGSGNPPPVVDGCLMLPHGTCYYADFSGLDLSNNTDLWGVVFIHCNFSGANLFQADLHESRFTDANFSGANLTRADLHQADLTNANLTNANLTIASLYLANLTNANLVNANLPNANLVNANLPNADLTRAELTNAELAGANLTNADLTNADLTNADLTEADLTNANLTNANLSGATFCVTTMPDGTVNNSGC